MPGGVILARWRIGGPSASDRAQQAVNEQLTGHRVDQAIKDHLEATNEPAAAPEFIEHPIDYQLQTGESRQLGGGIEIKAPWRRD